MPDTYSLFPIHAAYLVIESETCDRKQKKKMFKKIYSNGNASFKSLNFHIY